MNTKNNPLGNIYIAPRAIATIAYQAAFASYGLVGFSAKNLAQGLANVLVKDPLLGVDVDYSREGVIVDLYVIFEYGVRITSVASSISDAVRYQIEKAVGVPVLEINVHVRGLRISNTD
jgi:uncharacterized alkaline shock family protein YloU